MSFNHAVTCRRWESRESGGPNVVLEAMVAHGKFVEVSKAQLNLVA